MAKKYTDRGFRVYTDFVDTYMSDVRVQMSSAVVKRCWIFVKNEGQHPRSNLVTDGAIHLDTKQAKRVIKALEQFIKDK